MSQLKRKFTISKHVLEENNRKNEARRPNKSKPVEKPIKKTKDKTIKGCKYKNVVKDDPYTVCTDCAQVLNEKYHTLKEIELKDKETLIDDGVFTLYGNNRIRGYFSYVLGKFVYNPKYEDKRKVEDLRKIAVEKGIKYP